MSVFANSTGPTTVRNAFYIYTQDVHRLALASPFFSYSNLLRDLATADRVIDLIVRLGAATPPSELRKAISLPNVRIRFFTSSSFHSKLYIFGDRCALVGSANLTQQGMQSNREITISVTREHPDFDELVALFEAYWVEANVLDESRLRTYEALCSSTPIKSSEAELDSQIRGAFGDISPSQGNQVRETQVSPEKTYLEDYRRTYVDLALASGLTSAETDCPPQPPPSLSEFAIQKGIDPEVGILKQEPEISVPSENASRPSLDLLGVVDENSFLENLRAQPNSAAAEHVMAVYAMLKSFPQCTLRFKEQGRTIFTLSVQGKQSDIAYVGLNRKYSTGQYGFEVVVLWRKIVTTWGESVARAFRDVLIRVVKPEKVNGIMSSAHNQGVYVGINVAKELAPEDRFQMFLTDFRDFIKELTSL